MIDVATTARLWRLTWPRAALLAGLCLVPVVALGWWRVAAGFSLGCLLLLGDEYLLSRILGRLPANRGLALFALLALLHNVLVGVGLLVGLKSGAVHPLGLAVGASVPALATATLLLTRG
jgi:hypothetical protein